MSNRTTSYYIDNFAGVTESAMVRLVRDKITPRARWLLVVLVLRRDYEKPEEPFPCGMRDMRRLTGFSYATIRSRIRELGKAGIVKVTHKGGLFRTRNEYQLNVGYLGILT